MPTALVYSPELAGYNFGSFHPMQPKRLELTAGLIRACGLLEGGAFQAPPRPATRDELLRAHTSEYLDVVAKAGKGTSSYRHGLGAGDNPIFPGMDEVSALIAGASVLAVEKVLAGEWEHAFAMAGGLHHAMPGRASGFCVFNDAAVAIHAALALGAGRVLYVDIDAHHGDGVQTIFYHDPRVLTISIHESGRFLFPGTGFAPEIGDGPGRGFSVNVPLDPGAGDDLFIEAIERVVTPLARAFRPDLMVTQNGCDAHTEDPLTHLSLSLEGHARAVTALHDLAHEVCGGRIAALGGGGYSIYRVVPRAWTRAFAILAHRELQPLVPSAWREACKAAGGWDVPELFSGEEETRSPDDVLYGARESIEWIEENVFPLHGLARAGRE